MDLGGWLRKLGLEHYEAAFRENKIDDTVLPSLTAEDLKDLGVGFVGDRRKLLDAIAALRAGASAPTSLSDTPPATDETTTDTAERRQVTVMFSDLVGSTALSARMDLEDLREVMATYQKCVTQIVRRFDGFVAKYMGDGVLVYFGYPQAHEDDAERAVRAALEMISAVSQLAAPIALQTRVGVATGLVVVGEMIGWGATQEPNIVGETPNLAARLQGIAEPNRVVISESTRRLLGSLFELEDLGPQDLKGIAGPTRVWAALRASSVASRFEALHASGLTALVGREEEIKLLLRRWERAKRGEGQMVLLSGEAGIGKSRLMAALLERLADDPHTRFRYFCSPQHTDSAFYPIIGQMERAAGLAHDDTPQAKLDKLDALLTQTSTSIQDVALFAELLSLPTDGRYPALDLIPQQRRQKMLEAFVAQIAAFAAQRPVLMIFEDAHWIDPTSLEALGRAVDRIRALRVLLIVTSRPEFEPPWIGPSYVTPLTINRLAQREVDDMIDRVVGDKKTLTASVRRDIIERTDGIPLFVEEMTKAVLEAENEGEARRTAAAIPSPARTVPASLHASLMARLDRLGPAKKVAQIGAAIGREFSHAMLTAVMHKAENELGSALDRLIAAGLLFRQGVPPHATYLFKHALVQDAAYGTLLRGPRRALHVRIADALESQFAEIAERQPELLAHHCTEAGQIEKAADLWGKAGRRSLARSALVEAVGQLSRALGQIAALPATPARRREQIKLQVELIIPLVHVKGYAAPESKAAVERARLLIEQAEMLGEPLEDPLLLFLVLYGFWAASYTAFNGDVVRELATQFLVLAEKQGATPLMFGHSIMGVSLLCTGRAAEGRAHDDQAIALYDPAEHRPLAARFGQDVRVATLCSRSWGLWSLGYPEAARAAADQAISDAREIGQAATLMVALSFATTTCVLCGHNAAANALVVELVALADEKGAVLWKAWGTMNQGCISGLTGKALVDIITSGIAAWRSTGATVHVPLHLSNLTKAYAEIGQFDDAWRCISEAMTTIETTKETFFEADVRRTAGEIALLSPEPDAAKAEMYFDQALAVARAQQARSWELRAATSLARLWHDQGKHDEARDLLAPVYGWFTEGFDTRDLTEARALLNVLAS
jgi:class 3 adenylate cyclase/predicted ATPase